MAGNGYMVEIDGIHEALKKQPTEAGQLISDEYMLLIDVVTSGDLKFNDPNNLNGDQPNFERACRVAECIRKLNRNLGTTAAYLGSAGLSGVYNNVVEQVNEMVGEVEGMHGLRPIEPNSVERASVVGLFRR